MAIFVDKSQRHEGYDGSRVMRMEKTGKLRGLFGTRANAPELVRVLVAPREPPVEAGEHGGSSARWVAAASSQTLQLQLCPRLFLIGMRS
jgi:hypothetical protein